MNQPQSIPSSRFSFTVPGDRALTYLPNLCGVSNPNSEQLFLAQGGLCVVCGGAMKPIGTNPQDKLAPTKEHVFPRSLGCGTYANKALSHRCCNQRKADALPDRTTLRRVLDIYQAIFPEQARRGLQSHPLWAWNSMESGGCPSNLDLQTRATV